MKNKNNMFSFAVFLPIVIMLIFSAHLSAAPGIQWSSKKLLLEQKQGSQSSHVVTMTANQDLQNLVTHVVPELQPFITVYPFSIEEIEQGQNIQITVSVNIPDDANIGAYYGVVQIRAANVGKPAKAIATPLSLELTIIEETTPRPNTEGLIVVGKVSGNTASYNSVAEFTVRLSQQPTTNVIIPISSSDINEGVPNISSLILTPENWSSGQTVFVTGTNNNVQNGVQDYLIQLLPGESSDSDFDGLDADDVEMKGIVLELAEPTGLNDLISELHASFIPVLTYTGNKQVSFSLLEAPAGMQIDFNNGTINWTPPVSAEGNSFNVTARVTDGSLFSQISFPVSVKPTIPLQTSNTRTVVTVTETNSNLFGLSITDTSTGIASLTEGNLSGVEIELVAANSVPPIPGLIVPITDIFVIKAEIDTSVAIRLPLSQLPEGTGFDDVNLYGYVEAFDVPAPIWSTVLVDIDYEGDAENPVVVIHLNGVHGLLFFGVRKPEIAPMLESSTVSLMQQDLAISLADPETASIVADVTCVARTIYGVPNYSQQDCTWSGDSNFKVFVKDFGLFPSSTKWDGTTIQELIAWLVVAREKFETTLKLDSDSKFTVDIDTWNNFFDNFFTAGYVTDSDNENYGTLHLNGRIGISSDDMKATAAHEYFHHAQTRSTVVDKDLLITGDFNKTVWIIEGSAKWFEDFLYDTLDTYLDLGNGPRIMEHGLDDDFNKDDTLAPYHRFSFFKLLSENCSNFNNIYKELINHDKSADPSGINNLVTELGAASCNFGEHLGENKKFILYCSLKVTIPNNNKANETGTNITSCTTPLKTSIIIKQDIPKIDID